MADSANQEMSVVKERMNGHHGSNGVSTNVQSPLPHTNGHSNASKSPAEQAPSSRPLEKMSATINGVLSTHNVQPPVASINLDQLPKEIVDLLTNVFTDEAYVTMACLVERAAQTCWTDLTTLLNDLADIPVRDDVGDVISADKNTINDTSQSNRLKKQLMWDFAESHKRALIKLLVILQWSLNSQENKLTIAMNYLLQQYRHAFLLANENLGQWAEFILTCQDACPNLDTAAEILATGQIAGLPDLGYIEEKPLRATKMLSILRRLNSVLTIRMLADEHVPHPFRNWHIQDGRVTFTIAGEFDLAVSAMNEDPDAKFQSVDFCFNFRPAPIISDTLHDEITNITNLQLSEKGLEGAYKFLHDLVLTQKLKEMHKQALNLARTSWAGHLRVEIIRRTLVVQYWVRRSWTKSWLEIVINSGRLDSRGETVDYPVPYLGLRWMRYGKLIEEHDINMDLVHLSFEDILNQVVARHTNSIFDGIYDRLSSVKLFAEGDLELEQHSSVTDCFDCTLSIELSKMDKIQLSYDPVGGTIILSPASERSSRLQAELSRSKNVVEDFVTRFSALRCGIAQDNLSQAIAASSWQNLPGRKPSFNEVKDIFGPATLRAAFFRQAQWNINWMLAASFGLDGDSWWLVRESSDGRRTVQKVDLAPTHLQHSFTAEYFEALSKHAAATITSQVNFQTLQKRGYRTVLASNGKAHRPVMKVKLEGKETLSSFGREIIVSSWTSRRTSTGYLLVVMAHLEASKTLLDSLRSAGLHPSITIDPERKSLKVQLTCLVGDSRIDTAIARLHYIDDVVNCIKLVHGSQTLRMRELTLKHISIDYHSTASSTLGLALLFEADRDKSRVRLVPENRNPHQLVSQHVGPQLEYGTGSLSQRLRNLLVILRLTLPIVNCLQYLQGLVDAQDAPEMAAVDLDDSRKWLRIHIISRDMFRLGVHFFAINTTFKHDVEGPQVPETLLTRLEIEPQISRQGAKISWILRPAIEEFKTYNRPSFTSQALKTSLSENIFRTTEPKGWIPLDNAAKCLFREPQHLIIALHNTILSWLKDAVVKASEIPTAKAKAPPMINSKQNNRPNQSQQQQNRPVANPVAQPTRPVSQGQSMNNTNTSRVMTAAPQQVRQQLSNAQRGGRVGQGQGRQMPNQGQGQVQRGGAGGTGMHDAINLD